MFCWLGWLCSAYSGATHRKGPAGPYYPAEPLKASMSPPPSNNSLARPRKRVTKLGTWAARLAKGKGSELAAKCKGTTLGDRMAAAARLALRDAEETAEARPPWHVLQQRLWSVAVMLLEARRGDRTCGVPQSRMAARLRLPDPRGAGARQVSRYVAVLEAAGVLVAWQPPCEWFQGDDGRWYGRQDPKDPPKWPVSKRGIPFAQYHWLVETPLYLARLMARWVRKGKTVPQSAPDAPARDHSGAPDSPLARELLARYGPAGPPDA